MIIDGDIAAALYKVSRSDTFRHSTAEWHHFSGGNTENLFLAQNRFSMGDGVFRHSAAEGRQNVTEVVVANIPWQANRCCQCKWTFMDFGIHKLPIGWR
jgi:hypothetical protein